MAQSTQETIEKASKKLKSIQEIQPPKWASHVKTGPFKERIPEKRDWWHVRAAAILRKTHILGPIGVSKLRTKYGGKKNRGSKPEKFGKASGNHLRKILQQLEKANLVEQKTVRNYKGRIITKKGKELLYGTPKQSRGTSKTPTTDTDAGKPSQAAPNEGSNK
tara:strand:+ start:9126 stop:9614 length:489 start_codon:yes stop_codon:yes gene_type:complete